MDYTVKTLPIRPMQADNDSSDLRRPSREEAEAAVRTLIRWAGDDPTREGLVETPRRVVKAYEQLFEGYNRIRRMRWSASSKRSAAMTIWSW